MARKVRILLRWPQKILILMSTRRAACAGRAGGRFGNDSAIDSGGGEVRKPRKKRKSSPSPKLSNGALGWYLDRWSSERHVLSISGSVHPESNCSVGLDEIANEMVRWRRKKREGEGGGEEEGEEEDKEKEAEGRGGGEEDKEKEVEGREEEEDKEKEEREKEEEEEKKNKKTRKKK
ncbi:hypothetical protein M8J77_012275 [Diaphorina citri]|nr:hypothetical protein M8J77_012275 [Diaphorina citri]